MVATELITTIGTGALTIDVRSRISDGVTDRYLALTSNGELRTVSLSALELPVDVDLEWPTVGVHSHRCAGRTKNHFQPAAGSAANRAL